MASHRQSAFEDAGEPVRLSKKAVVVLGMHRSGTSLCMNILGLLGIRMDSDLLPANEHNERGFFESLEILQLNESILRSLGLTWHSLAPAAWNDNWVDDKAIAPAKRRLIAIVSARTGSGPGMWGFKDPRLCLLLPLYRQVFLACNVEPSYILCNRQPGAIALSLERRNKLPRLLSELLWMDHTTRAIECAGQSLKAVVQYESWFEDPLKQVRLLESALDLPAGPSRLSVDSLRNAIASDLDHARGRTEKLELSGTESVHRHIRDGRYEAASVEVSEIKRGLSLGMNPSAALCQVYWKTEEVNHFTEVDSYCAYTDNLPVRRTVCLQIPKRMQRITGLRLDPAESIGRARFYAIRLRDSAGALLWQWQGDREIFRWEQVQMTLLAKSEEPGVEAEFNAKDPHFILPIQERELTLLSTTGGILEFDFELLPESGIRNRSAVAVLESSGRKSDVSLCQLYWRTVAMNYFAEVNSCSVLASTAPGRRIVRLPIPSGVEGLTGLRLDPADLCGVAHVFSIRLLSSETGLVWEWDGDSENLLTSGNGSVTLVSNTSKGGVLACFHDTDPMLYLMVGERALESISGAGGIVEFEFAWLGIQETTVENVASANLIALEHALALKPVPAVQSQISVRQALIGVLALATAIRFAGK